MTNASYQIVESMATDAIHFFLRGLPTYSPCFNNSLSRIACHPNKDKASTCSGFNIIRFLAHIKPAFEKLFYEHALDAWVAKRRLAMVATRGHKYPVCATIPLWTPFFHDLQVSKRTLNSCLAPVYTLPLWMTLLLFRPCVLLQHPWNSSFLRAICCSSLFLSHAIVAAAC